MNILLLCNKSPFPPSEGGPMAMNSVVTGLLEAGHTVKVLAFNSNKYHVDIENIPQVYREKTRIEFIDVNLGINPKEAFEARLSEAIQRLRFEYRWQTKTFAFGSDSV